MRGLRDFFFACLRGPRDVDVIAPLPLPVHPVCIIGDLHGRLDLLEQMLEEIATRPDAGPHRVVFVGDMIDRGPESASVLHHLHTLAQAEPQQVVCLMGNHERMMLDFLADPRRHGPRWLANGGNETLASFGLSPWTRSGETDAEAWLKTRGQALTAALPGGSTDCLASLPLVWSEGTLTVAHAGADPACAIADQAAETLLWGHPVFLRQARRDGIWVAHGHTIVRHAQAHDGRIAVDTGAWRTNRLSAAWLNADGIDFIEVSASRS